MNGQRLLVMGLQTVKAYMALAVTPYSLAGAIKVLGARRLRRTRGG